MSERKNPYHGGNEPFTCTNCGLDVAPLAGGGQRNHCPGCLCSLHVDGPVPGDRASECGGLMRPISVDRSAKKGWVIVQRCETCGMTRRNKAANDDPEQPDSFDMLVKTAEVGPDQVLRRSAWEHGEAKKRP